MTSETYTPQTWPLHGYAPGWYFGGNCQTCKQSMENVDKRAFRCLKCATEMQDAERVRAAAPDLLDAGKDALDTFEKLRADLASIDAELHAQRIAVIDLQIAALSAAIAKAEGRS